MATIYLYLKIDNAKKIKILYEQFFLLLKRLSQLIAAP